MRFPRLHSPGYLGRRRLRNRIIMAPMEKNLATADGEVTQRYVDYCQARAAGGAALVLLESMYVDPAGKNHTCQLGLHDDALIPGHRRLVEACHRHGALVGAELQFAGRETPSTVTGVQPVAPSPVACTVLAGGEMPRELTPTEIDRIVDRFAEAAGRAVAAGFDVEPVALELTGRIVDEPASPPGCQGERAESLHVDARPTSRERCSHARLDASISW